jgi:hypothetical protein
MSVEKQYTTHQQGKQTDCGRNKHIFMGGLMTACLFDKNNIS